MSFLDGLMRDKAIYWAPAGYDRNAKPILAKPIEVVCNWSQLREEYINSEGQQTTSQAQVVVPIEMLVGGRLWKCPKKLICRNCCLPYAPPDPYDSAKFVFEIRKYEENDNPMGTITMRLVTL